jgi:hypothetical protein
MNRRLIKLLPLVCVAVLVFSMAWPLPAPTGRVVAIADIHGDFDDLVAILQRAGLIDANRHWTARNTTLVQTGDMVDRGPKSRAVLDLMMQLQKDASRQNSRVIVLLGNHEVMDMYGDLRYVVPADYASHADDKSQRRRKSAFEAYAGLNESTTSANEDQWMNDHPPGFIEHREAFGPEGKYGKWLRSLPAVAKVNDSIFLHGGLKDDFAGFKLEQINEAVSNEIKAFDAYQKYMVEQKIALPFFTLKELTDAATAALKETKDTDADRKKFLEGFLRYGSWMTVNTDGPLWFRGYAEWSDEQGAPQLAQLTKAFAVSRFVVGHTPQPGHITPRFNGQVYLIDTGMLSSYFPGGQASALEIQDQKVTAIYAKETKPLN